MKSIQRIISGLLVAAILISSIGYTAVSFACPQMNAKKMATCSMCKTQQAKTSKTKDCCKPIVEHKVVHADGTQPHEHQSVVLVQVVFAVPMMLLPNELDLFAESYTSCDFHAPPLPSDASTARAMLSTFLI